MKYKLYSILGLLALIATVSCEKKYDKVMTDIPYSTSKAYIKFVHASPSFRAIHNKPDTFNVFINGAKINSGALSFNGIWPFSVNSSTTSNTATYAAVEPGMSNIKLSVPGKAPAYTDSAAVLSIDKNLTGGKFYTFMITDSIAMERDSSRIFIEDKFKELPVKDGHINVRFINAVMNDTAGKTVNLSSYFSNASIFSNVKPGAATGFGQIGFNFTVPDTLYVRRHIPNSLKDTGRILAKVYFNSLLTGGSNPLKRSITVYYKGDGNVTTGAKARSIGAYLND